MGLSNMMPARLARPRSFLYFVSLRTASQFIILSLLFNKVAGFYGILALFTGYELNLLQLSMYIYSIVVLCAVAYLAQHMQIQKPVYALAVAWIYLIDSVINVAYTCLFGVGWFILVSQHLDDKEPTTSAPGGNMMNDTAGFTDPEHSVGAVEVIATPKAGMMPGQDAVAMGHGSSASLAQGLFESGSMMSLGVIAVLWTIRLYAVVIVMASARQTLRQYIQSTSAQTTEFGLTGGSDDANMAENPFKLGREEGEGWKGKLGRLMTAFPKAYWLGKDEADEEWARGTDERITRARTTLRLPKPGVGERERRARSGTGPPPPIKTGSDGDKDKSQVHAS